MHLKRSVQKVIVVEPDSDNLHSQAALINATIEELNNEGWEVVGVTRIEYATVASDYLLLVKRPL